MKHNCYTLSACIFDYVNHSPERLLGDFLYYLFIGEMNRNTVAIDDKGIITDIYDGVIRSQTDDEYRQSLITWLDLMTKTPRHFQTCKIDASETGDPFIAVCSKTVDKCLVVANVDNCRWSESITPDRTIQNGAHTLFIKDVEEVIDENQRPVNNIKDSIVAYDSKIKNSKINDNE